MTRRVDWSKAKRGDVVRTHGAERIDGDAVAPTTLGKPRWAGAPPESATVKARRLTADFLRWRAERGDRGGAGPGAEACQKR